jgi:hypothetical protein
MRIQNTPFSAIVCGVQGRYRPKPSNLCLHLLLGSGKSHTVSVMLENMFVPNCSATGSLKKALSGLVLHFGEGGPTSLPSEAAWLSVPSHPGVTAPKVCVYVSHASLNTMRAVYAPLGNRVTVEPLFFTEAELDAQAFLSMMAVGSSDSAPLYVQIILVRIPIVAFDFSHIGDIVYLAPARRELHVPSLYARIGKLQEEVQPCAALRTRAKIVTAYVVHGKRSGHWATGATLCARANNNHGPI